MPTSKWTFAVWCPRLGNDEDNATHITASGLDVKDAARTAAARWVMLDFRQDPRSISERLELREIESRRRFSTDARVEQEPIFTADKPVEIEEEVSG